MTRGTTMRRRSNKKSRYGCKECKQRHIKCDESRPSCAHCKTSGRECSFLASLAVRRVASISGSSTTSNISSIGSISSISSTLASPPASPSQDDVFRLTSFIPSTVRPHEFPPADQVFRLHHFELLNHFKTDMLRDFTLGETQAESFIDMTVRLAVRTPYLMDQLLAISAIHLSTRQLGREQFYRDEATSLQTRALASFNPAKVVMTDDNCLSTFLFSVLLSQHVIFDTLSTRTDFPTFLNKLVACFNICGGIKAIAGQYWSVIETQFRTHAGMSAAGDWTPDFDAPKSTTELSRLEALITNADLGPLYTNACSEALNLLYSLCGTPGDSKTTSLYRANLALRWLVRVPRHFVELIEQRRPEALIILTYFAVLILDARDYWVFGDAGKFIIRSITRFLGAYWADWLAWPNEVLARSESVETG